MPVPRAESAPHVLARFRQAELALKIERSVQAAPPFDNGAVLAGASADDAELRRGLPLIGRGCSGAIRGSQPELALLAAERRRRRC